MIALDWEGGESLPKLIRSVERLPGPRRMRLLAVAFCDRVARFLPDDASRGWIEVARRYADKKAKRTEMEAAHNAAWLAYAARHTRTTDLHVGAALRAVIGALNPTTRSYAGTVAHEAAHAVGHFPVSPPTHPSAPPAFDPQAEATESAAQLRLLRDVLGRPDGIPPDEVKGWLGWQGGVVPRLAGAIYDDRTFEQMPILADALEDAGCANEDLLAHCRGAGPHTRGCWVVDLLLGLA